MTRTSAPNSPPPDTQKSRADWISAAIDLLKSDGIDAVQITALARSLNITRGSFYWHFKNRDDLLEAVIEGWRTRNTGVILDALNGAETLDAGLLNLFFVWIDHTRFDPELDQALRDWARHAPDIAQITGAEDENRIVAIAEFLYRFGFLYPDTYVRARVIYLSQISHFAMGIDDSIDDRLAFLDPYFRCFAGRSADPTAVETYLARYREMLARSVE